MSALGTTALLDALVSHALATGCFDAVNAHQPLSAPGTGLSGAVWVDRIDPVPGASGLAATSARVAFGVRIHLGALTDPQDRIDPVVMDAVDHLMRAYSGDLTLGGLCRCVDLLGMAGEALSGRAGWLEQDGRSFRVFTIVVPVLVDDLWGQAP